MQKRAYAESRSMTWAQTAERYLESFEAAREQVTRAIVLPVDRIVSRTKMRALPEVNTGHFLSLCDGTGMLQHAVHSVANRAHGYCVDDNARALLLSSALSASGETHLPAVVTARFAAFVQHAWNPDTHRFRNFMTYDRRWLEAVGSEDSHGRTLWALGECAHHDRDPSRRRWAAALFKCALSVVEEFTAPRAWAFTLLGLDAYCGAVAGDLIANRMRGLLVDRLMSMLSAKTTKDWLWFEDVLAYDNARLPQALIQTGLATRTPRHVEAGRQSLRWLMALQMAPSGCFRPVGTQSFGRLRQPPEAFDQQPVEAAATISACLTAWQVDRGAEWRIAATRAFDWFLGENDLHTTLVDPATGGCSDGLHPDRPNGNMGAESALSYLLGLVELRQFVRAATIDRKQPASQLVGDRTNGAIAPGTIPGGYVVSIPFPKPPDLAPASGSRPGRRQALQAGDRAERPQSDG
jgi:hypothetical protein